MHSILRPGRSPHLSRVADVEFPGGRPVFPGVPAITPEWLLVQHGLKPGPSQVLDAKAGASLVTWRGNSGLIAAPQ